MSTSRLLRRKAASEYLHEAHGWNCAHSTLAKYAVIGGGPAFRRIGRFPYYTPEHLDEWVASKLSGLMRSTSDEASANARTVPDQLGQGLADEKPQRKPPEQGAMT